MKKLFLVIASTMAVSSMLSEKAIAESYVHDGFFLRIAPGFGWNKTSTDSGGNTLELSGTSGLFNFSIGGAVAQDLILHLDLTGVATSNPEVTYNGNTQPTSVTESSTSLLGIGLTSYFSSNYYITGALGIAKSKNKSAGKEGSTENGLGVNILLGKEWWVSENWGLGLAGQFMYTKCRDQSTAGSSPDVQSTTFGLLLSATYN